MPVSKSSNITDFFKPFSQPRQPKRPLPEDDLHQSQPSRRSRSSTPPSYQRPLPIRSCENTPSKPRAKGHDLLPQNAALDASTENAITDQLPFFSSQGPILASSQRVVKNGEVVVTNSDDEGTDSDASLGDIDELLRARRPPAEQVSSPLTELDSIVSTPGRQSSPDYETATTTVRRSTRWISSVKKPTASEELPNAPKYKFDLESLVKQSKKDEILEEGMAKARDLLATLEQVEASPAAEESRNANRKGPVDAELIVSMINKESDENDTKRLMLAIERTEALQQDLSWSFFEDEQQTLDNEPDPFSDAASERWNGILNQPASRQQAFLGGFVGGMATTETLPNQLLTWLFDAGERRSYAAASTADRLIHVTHMFGTKRRFEVAGKNLDTVLTPGRIDNAFRRLGANSDALDMRISIVPIARANSSMEGASHLDGGTDNVLVEGNPHYRPTLVSLIKLLGDIAVQLSASSRTQVISILCRLLVDRTIVHNSHAVVAIEEALDSIVDAIAEDCLDNDFRTILNALFDSLTDVTLRSQLIQAIPAFSARLTLFRRRLALAFFFNDSSYLSKPEQDLMNLGSISHRLTTPKFTIKRDQEINFSELAASISILNVGVGSGDPPLAGINEKVENAFNGQVDKLSRTIKTISTNIIDNGASQLKRTEAKEVLECFNFRLMYAVRTKPRPKNTPFGNPNLNQNRKIDEYSYKNMLPSRKQAPTESADYEKSGATE